MLHGSVSYMLLPPTYGNGIYRTTVVSVLDIGNYFGAFRLCYECSVDAFPNQSF